jgi:AraC-like DNA-binding protein
MSIRRSQASQSKRMVRFFGFCGWHNAGLEGALGRRGRRKSKPTLRDVAREAGVSPATASRAFNGSSTRNVKQEHVSRVLAAQRRERARIRSERQQRWGRPRPKAA